MDDEAVAWIARHRDYGECIPNCPLCEGTGWVAAEGRELLHHPNSGKLALCPNKRNLLWDNTLGISEAEASLLNLDTLQPTSQYNKALPYLKHLLNKGSGWLWIEGKPGVGKTTFLKAAVLQWRYIYSGDAQYVVHSEIVDHLRSSFGKESKSGEFEARMQFFYNKPFLAIDEIGRDMDTDFSKKSFGKILDHRYNMALAGNQITMFASNLSPEDVFEGYVVDRIRDIRFQMVKLDGPSARETVLTLSPKPDWWRRNLTI